jgi:hypothetical protein
LLFKIFKDFNLWILQNPQTLFLMCNTSYKTSIWWKMKSRSWHCNIYFLYDFVFSLKMAFITVTCRWWLITNKVVYRLDLYLLKHNGDALSKKK